MSVCLLYRQYYPYKSALSSYSLPPLLVFFRRIFVIETFEAKSAVLVCSRSAASVFLIDAEAAIEGHPLDVASLVLTIFILVSRLRHRNCTISEIYEQSSILKCPATVVFRAGEARHPKRWVHCRSFFSPCTMPRASLRASPAPPFRVFSKDPLRKLHFHLSFFPVVIAVLLRLPSFV